MGKDRIGAGWAAAFFWAILIGMVCAFPVTAAEKVRVGCVDLGNFIQIDPDGSPSGYGAEYLDKVAEYTGWEYEYVQASWEDCLDMLRKGGIDLLLPAEYSKERAKDFLFSSYECCYDFVALVGRGTDSRFYYNDFAGFDGIRIGMIKGSFLNGLFGEYAGLRGFGYRPVYYATGSRLNEALESGEVDAIINGNMEFNVNQKLLAKIDYVPAYFITSIRRPELMERLDWALKQIFIENPYYSAALHGKYYGGTESRFAEFTREEAGFARESGPVDVLVEPDDYPFSWYDRRSGTCRGAFVDYMQYLEKVSGLSFRFVPCTSGASLRDDLEAGKGQVVLSAYRHRLENDGSLYYTDSYYNYSFSLVGKKDGGLDLSSHQRIAVVRQVEGLKELLAKKYPIWEIIAYDTPEECLRAVEERAADCAMVSSIKLSADRTMLGTELVVVDGSTASTPVYMAVSGQADPLLPQILSKSIAKAGSGPIDEAIYRTLLSAKEHRGVSYFVQTYPVQFAITIVAISLMAMGIIFISYDSRHQKLQNMILQKKNEELKAAIALQKQLRREAQTDRLTGLKNKAATEELCRACMEGGLGEGNFALFVLDLDDFKHINDVHGHQEGDMVLKAFGSTLLGCIRQDDIAGRIGGDEFLVFMPGVKDKGQAEKSAVRIFQALKENQDFIATCSMGIALARCGQMTYEEMFQKADAALYKAKGRGKNQYYVEDGTGL